MSISLPNGTLLATPAQQTPYTAAVTRILHLSNFDPQLKTRDLQIMFKEYEADKGGYRIKWVDDVNALVVFADAGVAKRAYLSFLLSPPPTFSSPAAVKPYDRPDAAQIIQTLTARAMGHRSSMSSFNQTAPMAQSSASTSALDGMPNAHHHRAGSMTAVSSAGNPKASGSGSGWTFPTSRNSISIPSSNTSTGLPANPTIGGSGIGGSAPSSTASGPGLSGRHIRTGSASSSFSRQPLAGLGGALNFALPSSKTSRLPTHDESLDSPAIPAGFSTGKGEGVGGGQSRRLTGRAGQTMGSISQQNQAPGSGGAGLGLGVTRSISGTSSTDLDRGGSASGAGSYRSASSSDNEPQIVMDHAPTPEPGQTAQSGHSSVSGTSASTINGRGRVPFGQWKMPSSTSPSGSSSASLSNSTLAPAPAPGTGTNQARRDSHSADKAMREVQKALAGIEARG